MHNEVTSIMNKLMRKILFSLLVAVLLFASCTEYIIVWPDQSGSVWTVVITSSPDGLFEDVSTQQSTRNDFVVPDAVAVDGYSFIGYVGEDGIQYEAGDIIEYDGKYTYEITARYVESIQIGDGTTGEISSISDAISSTSSAIVAVTLPTGEYTEEDISVPSGRTLIIDGNRSSKARTLTNSSQLIGTIKLSEDSSLIMRNVSMTSDTTNGYLITANSGGVSVKLEETVLTTPEGGRGINFAVDSNPDDFIEVSLHDSVIYMVGQNARGINIDGDSIQRRDSEYRLDFASLVLDNSKLIEQKSTTTTTGAVYAVNIFRADKADVDIINGSEIQIDSRYYYAFRFFNVGTANEVSTIDVSDSSLQGWSALYIQSDSKNVKATIENSTLVGHNYSDGYSDGFSTIGVDSSSDCSIVIRNSDITAAQDGASGQTIASIYYYDNTGLTGGNTIEFANCNITFQPLNHDEPMAMSYYDNIITQEGVLISNRKPNEIIYDSATLASLDDSYHYETGRYAINPEYTYDDYENLDEDGYIKLPYEDPENRIDYTTALYTPNMGNGNAKDNLSYQYTTDYLMVE